MLCPSLPLLLLLSASAATAQAARSFTIGGEAFAHTDILDARALPQIDGTPVVMITFDDAAAKRIQDLTRRTIGKPLPIAVDGKVISSPTLRSEIGDAVIEVSGLASLEDAAAVAKLISGKEPLPDSLEDAP